jgi:hypothetical protein
MGEAAETGGALAVGVGLWELGGSVYSVASPQSSSSVILLRCCSVWSVGCGGLPQNSYWEPGLFRTAAETRVSRGSTKATRVPFRRRW